jgi:hypothetical protein
MKLEFSSHIFEKKVLIPQINIFLAVKLLNYMNSSTKLHCTPQRKKYIEL